MLSSPGTSCVLRLGCNQPIMREAAESPRTGLQQAPHLGASDLFRLTVSDPLVLVSLGSPWMKISVCFFNYYYLLGGLRVFKKSNAMQLFSPGIVAAHAHWIRWLGFDFCPLLDKHVPVLWAVGIIWPSSRKTVCVCLRALMHICFEQRLAGCLALRVVLSLQNPS